MNVQKSEGVLARTSRKLLQGARLVSRQRFEFDLYLMTVSNWQTLGALRRFAIRWQRGEQRSGVSSAVYPLPLARGEETRSYSFKETITFSAVLFRTSAGSWCEKDLVISLLEVDPTGKKAEELGTFVLDLSHFVAFDGTYSASEQRKFTLNPSVSAPRVPALTFRLGCRLPAVQFEPPGPEPTGMHSLAEHDPEDDAAATLPARGVTLPPASSAQAGEGVEEDEVESPREGALSQLSGKLHGRSSMRISGSGKAVMADRGTVIASDGGGIAPATGAVMGRVDGDDGGTLRAGSNAARQVAEAAASAAEAREQASEVQKITQLTLQRAAKKEKALLAEVEELKAEIKAMKERRLEAGKELGNVKVELSKARASLAHAQEGQGRVAELEERLRQESEEHFALKLKHDVLVDMYTLQMLDMDHLQEKLAAGVEEKRRGLGGSSSVSHTSASPR